MNHQEKQRILEAMDVILAADFGKNRNTATKNEVYFALSKAVMSVVSERWNRGVGRADSAGERQAFYLSAEYLMGRALGNNLLNLGYYDELLKEVGYEIEDEEEDAGLGNGGLGRLAACFLDSAASLNLPLHGYGIRYEYGIFEQKFEDGSQVEVADNWLKRGDAWSFRRYEDRCVVNFSSGDVLAIPYDTPVIGYGGKTVNTLRLWKSEPIEPFDFVEFNDQQYAAAVYGKNRAENISRVLYPNDSTRDGKLLRIMQQYFFSSASIQDLYRKYGAKGIEEKVALQLNDTHPVVAIPELIRLLMEHDNYGFEEALALCRKVFAYTNHTLLAEALEKWDVSFFAEEMPKIHRIIEQLDHALREDLRAKGWSEEEIAPMGIIQFGTVHMAHIAIFASHSVNGVAQLHSDLLEQKELANWAKAYPGLFNNKTNGITQRRWLMLANPKLSAFITRLLGTKDWATDLSMLRKLEQFASDDKVIEEFLNIKFEMKQNLANHIEKVEGVVIDPNAIFDIQIKRMHEYKRQLLNAFQILHMYFELKDNPNKDFTPRVFIFGGKSAPGYARAKGVIRFINEIAKLVNHDASIGGKIKVVFVTNYRVSYAEKLFPAADVSEQISTAGKEASGTGNMKFMLNGTVTVGTMDGANVEIVEEAGLENNYIFGATVEEIENDRTYNPAQIYNGNPSLKRCVDTLVNGMFSDGGTGAFHDLYHSLINGTHWQVADNYRVFGDFYSYVEAQEKIGNDYRDRLAFGRKQFMNLCGSGKFSSDRTIKEYADEIWKIG